MKTMKWETLKRKAIEQIDGRLAPDHAGWPHDPSFLAILPAIQAKKHPRALLQEWHDAAVKIVEQWDVRKAAELIKCFPDIVPKTWAGNKVSADYDEDAEWVVMFE